ncbi:amidase [Parvibaculum sp.]|uniref:amidase n=1 Tax=Parvibaculum sp. TaxID=2024848 RepID=UPI00320FCC27
MTSDFSPLSGASELCRLGAVALTEAYAKGSLSPVEVAAAALDRAEEINPRFNAFTFIDREGAIASAQESEKRWRAGKPLSAIDGVPTTLKDIVWIEGWSVRYGSLTTDASPCVADAPSVQFLRRAGAVFLGLTATPEFGWKAVTDSAFSGVTRNPWNADKTPGGSSGGAAVAAATGAGVLHLGTDGGGSIRIPASFTGITGHKPTFGRVAAYPASAFGTVAHIGPMARRAEDTFLMLQAMSGRDLRDWAQGAGELAPLALVDKVLSGARIGYWTKPPCGKVDPEVAAAVDAAVKSLEGLGARIEPIDLPGDDLPEIFSRHWFSGAANRLSAVPAERRGMIDKGFLEVAAAGAAYSAPELVAAQVKRAQFGAAMDELLTDYDFVVSPGTAIPAFAAGEELPPESGLRRWTEWAGFSFPINLSQQPACVVPCGRTAGGLPIGLQIIGARGADAKVLSAARAFETSFPAFFI